MWLDLNQSSIYGVHMSRGDGHGYISMKRLQLFYFQFIAMVITPK